MKSSKEKARSATTAIFTSPVLLLQIPLCDYQLHNRIEERKLNVLVGRGRQVDNSAPSFEILLTVERFARMAMISVGLLGALKVFRAWAKCPASCTISETAGILEKVFFIIFSHWQFEEIQIGLLNCLHSKFMKLATGQTCSFDAPAYPLTQMNKKRLYDLQKGLLH